MMSKRIFCLLCLGLALVLSGCGFIQALFDGNLISAHILTPQEYALGSERLALISEPEELQAIAAALQPGETAAAGDYGRPYLITLNYQRATAEYQVYVNDDAVIFAFEGGLYAASAEHARALLALPSFTGRYIAPLLTPLDIVAGTERFSLPPESYSLSVNTPSGIKNAAAEEAFSGGPLPLVSDCADIVISGAPAGSKLEISYSGATGEAVDEPAEAGIYSCAALASLAAGKASGTLSYRFDFRYEPPFAAIISAAGAEQSGSLAVLLENTSPQITYSLRAGFREQEIAFSALGKAGQIALLGVGATQKAGEYVLDILADEAIVASFTVTVEKKSFKQQHLTVSTEQAAMRSDPENAASDSRKTAAAKANPEPALLCDGTFIMPCVARISTEFAQERYINGALSSRHSGVDIAALQDTPALATARGKVVFAEELILSGNTVILDHGAGIFSSYCHLNEFKCEVGSVVEQGDTVGLVGSTGFSTGPHLHWSVSLHGTNINPLALVENSQILAVLERQ